MPEFPPLSSLIPHSGPSRLLEAVVHFDGERTECSARIDLDHPYLELGQVHSLLAIELFAQGAAVHRALSGRSQGKPIEAGRLAGANVRLLSAHLRAPVSLLVRVTPAATLGHLHSFAGQLYQAGPSDVLLAEGDVSVAIEEGSSWPAPQGAA